MRQDQSEVLRERAIFGPVAVAASATSADFAQQPGVATTLAVQIGVGGITFDADNALAVVIEESDDGVAWVSPDPDLVDPTPDGDGAVLVLASAHAAPSVTLVSYRGTAQRLRVRLVLTGTHDTPTLVAITAIEGEPVSVVPPASAPRVIADDDVIAAALAWLAPLADLTPPAAGESLAVALGDRVAGTAPLTFALTGASTGVSLSGSTLTLDATALSAGAPLAGTVTVSDGFGQSAASAFSLAVGAAASGPVIAGPLLALAGDSRLAQGATFDATTNEVRLSRAKGPDGWLGLLTGYKLDPRYSTAVGGTNSGHLVDVQMPKILAFDPLPDAVLMLCGTNDRGTSPIAPNGPFDAGDPALAGDDPANAGTTIANYHEFLSTMEANGITVLVISEMPDGATGAAETAHLARREWLQTRAISDYSNTILVDVFDALLRDGETNRLAVEYWDGTEQHQNADGSYLMAQVAATAAASALSGVTPQLLLPTASNGASFLHSNGVLAGTTGAKFNSVTGDIATDWIATKTNAALTVAGSKTTVVDPLDGETYDVQRFTIESTGAAGGIVQLYRQFAAATLVEGEEFETACRISIPSIGGLPLLGVSVRTTLRQPSPFTEVETGSITGASPSPWLVDTPLAPTTLKSPILRIGATQAAWVSPNWLPTVEIEFSANATAAPVVIDVWRLGLRKIP